MNKKIMILTLVLGILAISLAACGSIEPAATTVTQPLVSTPAAGPEATESNSEPVGTATGVPTEAPYTEISTEAEPVAAGVSYPIVDTGQATCYDDSGAITCPAKDEAFYGQDAQFTGNVPSYTVNGDPSTDSGQVGTVTDNVTGLVWQQSPDTDGDGDIDASDKMSYAAAGSYCENLSYAGQTDWQLPTIKQLYSLIDFSGVDPSGYESTDTSGLIPFIDTDYFDFAYGDTSANERIIDSQYASSNFYVDGQYLFGVNFADGRIKGYGLTLRGQDKTFDVVCVRENSTYGVNDFVDNGDPSTGSGQAGTITDRATGLTWAQDDSGSDAPDGLNWEGALAYVQAQNDANYLGYSDWRLPNIKELQSIVDYGRSPDSTNSAAIDPLFNATPITNEAGETDYAFYWSSTTHANWTDNPGSAGAYVSFGRAMGYMEGAWSDVHGAGAQRSDPKSGDPADWPTGNGPQGDAIRIYNYVRLVRGGDVTGTPEGDPTAGSAVTVADLAGSDSSALPVDQAGGPPTGSDSQPAGPGGEQMPDLAAAAAQLGVSEETLQAALGDPGQGPPDFAAAAQALGVTESDLMAALGMAEVDQPAAPGDQPADAESQPAGSGGEQRPDLAAAAAQLGVTEETLQTALGDPGQGSPDFAAAAQALGVTESDLMAALGIAEEGTPPEGQPPTDQQDGPGGQQMPDLAAAAAQLGVTEAALQAALGDPAQGPPDFAAAAQALGVTESDLMAALGMLAGGPPPGGPPQGGQPPGDSPPGGQPPTNSP